jgi:hypothetical protein
MTAGEAMRGGQYDLARHQTQNYLGSAPVQQQLANRARMEGAPAGLAPSELEAMASRPPLAPWRTDPAALARARLMARRQRYRNWNMKMGALAPASMPGNTFMGGPAPPPPPPVSAPLASAADARVSTPVSGASAPALRGGGIGAVGGVTGATMGTKVGWSMRPSTYAKATPSFTKIT